MQFEWSQSPNGEPTLRNSAFSPLRTQPLPAALQNRRINQSPVDALIDLIVWCGLRRHIPVWLGLYPVILLHTTVVPQRGPACRGDARWFGLHTNVVESALSGEFGASTPK